MKRILLFLSVVLLQHVSAFAYNFQVDGIYYDYVSSNVQTDVQVTYKEYSAMEYRTDCAGVINIPERVFYNGEYHNVVAITNYAFNLAKDVTAVNIPTSVRTIGSYAFRGTGIESIDLQNVTRIEDYTFKGCENLVSVTANGVATVGNYAFEGCTSLAEFVQSEAVKVSSIGDYAFDGCTSLTSISAAATQSKLGTACLRNTAITSFTANANTISNYAFSGCKNLETLIIGASCGTIYDNSFANCTSLTNLRFEDGSYLLTVGSSTTRAVFGDCPIETVYFGRRMTIKSNYGLFNYSTTIRSAEIGNAITSIPDGLLSSASLTTITIPAQVTSIGSSSLACPTLTSINCLATTPPALHIYSFQNVDRSIPVVVPRGCVEAYKNAEYWSEFTNIQEPAVDVTLTDKTVFSNPEQQTNCNITYTRDFTDTNWQPLFIPFAISYDDWSEDFVVARLNAFYEFSDDGVSKKKVEFIVVDDANAKLKPNHPYLIKAKSVGEKTITVDGVTLYSSDPSTFDQLECSTVETRFYIDGSYVNDESILGKYYVSNGKFWLDETGYNTLPYRWFISSESKGSQLDSASPSYAKPHIIDISVLGDDTNGITEVCNDTDAKSKIYSLDGRRLSAIPAKGTIYIVNGRKYISK